MKKKVEFIIVGQGIAGTIFSYELMQRNKTFIVIDDFKEETSSRIALGIYNPLVLKWFTKSWKAHGQIEELFTFIWNGHKSEAMKGYNDDLVLSLCIALWVRDTAIRLRGDGIEKQKTMLDFMGSTLALEKEGVYKNPLPNGVHPYEMPDGHGSHESLDWLLD